MWRRIWIEIWVLRTDRTPVARELMRSTYVEGLFSTATDAEFSACQQLAEHMEIMERDWRPNVGASPQEHAANARKLPYIFRVAVGPT